MTASLPICNAGPEVVLQIYYEWCKWLEFPQELPHIVLERLYQGGEYLRSLLQFMARSSEPHRLNDDVAEWRSQNAMQTTCMLFTAPGWGAPNTLAATCLELLGGLQPGCQGFSLHICTVLQHLLIAHEPEALTLLLHYQTPFVLLRALNRPGCSEILQVLLGADAVLPKLVPHISMRPLQVHSLQQVRQYLLAFQWPRYLEAVMSGAIAASLESREPASSPPGTPISQVNYESPGPTLLDPSNEQAKVTPCSTPQRWLCGTPEATPFQSLEAHKSSPSEERESSSLRCMTTPQKQVLCTPPRRTSELIARDSPEDPQEASRGVGVLLDFLSSILHAFKRSDQVAERSLARMAEDWESQERAKVQVLLLKDFFIDVPGMVSSLCLLIGNEFESASLLNSLLQHALQIQGSQPELVDALVTQCLQQLDAIFSALGLQLLKMRSSVTQGRSEALRLNGYVVQEPLGALRVEVVQIVSVLSRLAPERFLPLVKPAVWSAFAKWFFMYRCNHIFQAACSKLWVQVIRYGSQKLQYHIFINLRLFSGLCDAILTEGTCGDRWHNLTPAADRCGGAQRMEKRQVTTSRPRHPGGLGAIVQVVRALADTVAKPQVFTERKPLAEKLPQTQVISKETKVFSEQQSLLKKMVSASSLWPQVLKALPPPAKAVKIVATVAKSSAPFDI